MEEKIYLRVSRALEDDILSGALHTGDQIPSTQQVAERHGINPATAARGVAVLTAEGLFTKRRGIGLFVAPHAREQILSRRRAAFRDGVLRTLLEEAQVIGISRRDLVAMIMSS